MRSLVPVVLSAILFTACQKNGNPFKKPRCSQVCFPNGVELVFTGFTPAEAKKMIVERTYNGEQGDSGTISIVHDTPGLFRFNDYAIWGQTLELTVLPANKTYLFTGFEHVNVGTLEYDCDAPADMCYYHVTSCILNGQKTQVSTDTIVIHK